MGCKQKHEDIFKYLGDQHWTCGDCGTKFEYDEIIILTKAQHEAREDAMEEIKNTATGYLTGRNAAPQSIAMIIQTLDALDKGE